MPISTQDLETSSLVSAAIAKHGASREALIPILSEVNRVMGYIPAPAFAEIKRQLNLPGSDLLVQESQLYSLASFYHMLSTEKLGRHVIRFCESAPCHVVGGRDLLQSVQAALGIVPGETTADQKWSLITTSCLGVCAVGPVLLIDDDIYGNVSPDQVPGILDRYE